MERGSVRGSAVHRSTPKTAGKTAAVPGVGAVGGNSDNDGGEIAAELSRAVLLPIALTDDR